MLAILSYCYAQEVYSSLKISYYISGDKAFHTVLPKRVPQRAGAAIVSKTKPGCDRKCLASILHYLAGQRSRKIL
jgi:hypothetical protein